MESGAIFIILGTFVIFIGVFLFNPFFHELLGRWEPLLSVRRIAFISFGLLLFLYGKSVNEEYQKTDLFKERVADASAEAWCQEAFRSEVNGYGLNPMRFEYDRAKIEGKQVYLTAKGGFGYPDYDVECWMDSTLKSVISILLIPR